MWICNDCGEMFQEPKKVYENQGEFWGAPAWEAFGACPFCESTDIDEMKRCKRCGEWIESGDLCDCCEDDLFG